DAQFLSELREFHRVAASAEQQSIASAWERIEQQRGTREKRRVERGRAPSERRMNEASAPLEFRSRLYKRRGLTTLVAVLVALLLIGGVAVSFARNNTFLGNAVGSPTVSPASGTVSPSATSTQSGQQKDGPGAVIYTNKGTDNGMMVSWSPDGKRIL